MKSRRERVLSRRDIGAGRDAKTHLMRIYITDLAGEGDGPDGYGPVLLDRMMTDDAAWKLGMQLARAACPTGTVLVEVDLKGMLRDRLNVAMRPTEKDAEIAQLRVDLEEACEAARISDAELMRYRRKDKTA